LFLRRPGNFGFEGYTPLAPLKGGIIEYSRWGYWNTQRGIIEYSKGNNRILKGNNRILKMLEWHLSQGGNCFFRGNR
jgi:hypothetical protein